MTGVQDPADPEPPASPGHVRIFVNAKGERQWTVTARVGETFDQLDEARVNAERVAALLAAGAPAD